MSKRVEKKLSDEFPSLASLSSQPTVAGTAPKAQCEVFRTSEMRTPENMMHSELSQQDFSHELYSTMPFIPDPPYDSEEITTDENTGFPQKPHVKLVHPEIFSKYDLSTLCFIFFYRPGSAQQYFAARELKQRGWVFHIKYQTWFRRVGDPVEKTDTYEVGKYEYFDHGTNESWCIRMKPSFKFEYSNMSE